MAMNTFQQRMLTANATAETFIHAVYTAWDSDRKTLEHLYRPASRIIWNGNPISGSGEMLPFIEQMPASKHDLQAFDCHPLPGATETGQPTISITVSGTVLFYNASEGEPAAPPPRVPGQRAQKRDQNTPREEDPDLLPRLFSHVFIIAPDVNEQGTLMYAIQSEAFRFVG